MLSSLNQRATLQAKTLSPDGGGGYRESWQSFAQVWVGITPLGASDIAVADGREAKARHRLTLRRRSDLQSGQRVVAGGRSFLVRSVLDQGPPAALIQLLCEELP